MKVDKNEVPDSFQAYLVEGASFTKTEEYPILKEDMISKNIPIDINGIKLSGQMPKTSLILKSERSFYFSH